jgi:hypothetical protein
MRQNFARWAVFEKIDAVLFGVILHRCGAKLNSCDYGTAQWYGTGLRAG